MNCGGSTSAQGQKAERLAARKSSPLHSQQRTLSKLAVRSASGHLRHFAPRGKATGHSITRSAASKSSGMIRLRTFAVLRLNTRSNLVGCCTCNSAAFSMPELSSHRWRHHAGLAAPEAEVWVAMLVFGLPRNGIDPATPSASANRLYLIRRPHLAIPQPLASGQTSPPLLSARCGRHRLGCRSEYSACRSGCAPGRLDCRRARRSLLSRKSRRTSGPCRATTRSW